jgi:hypothetical protein
MPLAKGLTPAAPMVPATCVACDLSPSVPPDGVHGRDARRTRDARPAPRELEEGDVHAFAGQTVWRCLHFVDLRDQSRRPNSRCAAASERTDDGHDALVAARASSGRRNAHGETVGRRELEPQHVVERAAGATIASRAESKSTSSWKITFTRAYGLAEPPHASRTLQLHARRHRLDERCAVVSDRRLVPDARDVASARKGAPHHHAARREIGNVGLGERLTR